MLRLLKNEWRQCRRGFVLLCLLAFALVSAQQVGWRHAIEHGPHGERLAELAAGQLVGSVDVALSESLKRADAAPASTHVCLLFDAALLGSCLGSVNAVFLQTQTSGICVPPARYRSPTLASRRAFRSRAPPIPV